MLQAGGARKLVALKAVDSNWPLVGTATLGSGGAIGDALGDGRIAVDPQMAKALDLTPGSRVRIGEAELTVSDTLTYEPDRSVSFVTFGHGY